MTHPIKSPRKLIEVALPLDAINEASAREKSIRHGHPSTLHLWWARRPLAAAPAIPNEEMRVTRAQKSVTVGHRIQGANDDQTDKNGPDH
jgi:hypothetical protein